jgi:hypothetical protein
MKILFNLAAHRSSLNLVSENDIGLAHAILTRVCLDNGFPVKNAFFDKNVSPTHLFLYETIKEQVESQLFLVPEPEIAVLSDLGHLQFQLTTHTQRQQCIL